ncbi:TetR/AcrR family transcriptional regulator [Phytomonospora endophytica]|uniref:AcrR family transcriptional regulator n=1 Tax=Phytomonospora endophytica TaxID=714109 RepID=A0A841FBD7_9ACTN|nr:TetR family transcriptional regulator [Phytomonospora endophytica]MBB6032635.1 AcrR family transcriptional regulator [Phytomonospora endophytica]GIG66215.1 hypothetical protein Pen01_25100 [Phytomonospora endophytica]
MPRRAPEPDARRRDAERTRRRLLDAAFDAFAEHGYAGARVQDIADRAGVNKQLITYYFGGKAGLYQALQEQWLRREEALTPDGDTLADLVATYVRHAAADPRGIRLMLWRGLTDAFPEDFDADPMIDADLADTRARQETGELPADVDARALRLVLYGMVVAPVAMPELVRRSYGVAPDSPGFVAEYTEQVRRLIRHLGARGETDTPEETP